MLYQCSKFFLFSTYSTCSIFVLIQNQDEGCALYTVYVSSISKTVLSIQYFSRARFSFIFFISALSIQHFPPSIPSWLWDDFFLALALQYREVKVWPSIFPIWLAIWKKIEQELLRVGDFTKVYPRFFNYMLLQLLLLLQLLGRLLLLLLLLLLLARHASASSASAAVSAKNKNNGLKLATGSPPNWEINLTCSCRLGWAPSCRWPPGPPRRCCWRCSCCLPTSSSLAQA